MTKEKNKFAEAVLGILTGITLWGIGQLLSGRSSIVEDVELYKTGALVFIFPLLFFGVCMGIAKYAAKNSAETYFKSALIMFFVPLIAGLVSAPFINADLGMVVGILSIILMFLSAPAAAVLSQMYVCTDKIVMGEGAYLIAMILLIVPMLAGLVCSVILYRKWQGSH